MQEQPREELQPERVRIVRQESLIAKGLEDKLQNLLLAEADVENVMENTARLARALETGEEPDFSWVPDRLRVQVISEWNEARERVEALKEARREERSERATELAEEVEDLELKEAAERAAKLDELERQFEEASQEVSERAERRARAAEPTMVVRPKRSFFERMLGRHKKSE